MKKILFSIYLSLTAIIVTAQQIKVLTEGTKTSIRGLSVVSNSIIWASGSNGLVIKTTDAGKHFTYLKVKGYEQRDFRDIKAFDSNMAIIMAVAQPALILKTKDGGNKWYKVFEDTTKGMFLDAMDFNGNYGIVIGDPINNQVFKAITYNKGESWKTIKNTPLLHQGEAFFAASGSNISLLNVPHKKHYPVYVSGGKKSRLFFGDTIDSLPIIQGTETTGANSISVNMAIKKAVVVGGDFANDRDTTNNCVLIDFNNGITFYKPKISPHGYRSCVLYINQKTIIACGTSGVDISYNGGITWQLISSESFHVVQKSAKINSVYLAGNNGRIAEIIF